MSTLATWSLLSSRISRQETPASQDQLLVRYIYLQIHCLHASLSYASLYHFGSSYLIAVLLSVAPAPPTTPPPTPPPPPPALAKQALLRETLGLVQQKSSLQLLVQGMHSRDRLPTVASCLPSSLHGQAEAEAGVGGEGSGGGGGGEQVQQDQLMRGALFQVILQQLGEPFLHITHTSPAARAYWLG